MDTVCNLKNTIDDFSVEFEIESDIVSVNDKKREIQAELASLDNDLAINEAKITKLDSDIDTLTNQSDKIDYSLAVVSGLVTGIIDSMCVGNWNFAKAKGDVYKELNAGVINFAKKQPDYQQFCNFALEGKGGARRNLKDPNRLESAIDFLEWKFHLPGDGAYSLGKFGIDGNTHRLDDFCHHPTIVGLISCIIVQFTGSTLYVNKFGENINIPITVNEYGNFVGKNTVTKMFAGVINWFICCAKTLANRKGHLMSDIATSASLPGTFLSTIAELSSIPCFRDEAFLVKLRDAYKYGVGTDKGVDLGAFNALFEGAQNKLDVVTEMAIASELKRQALPVIINEVIVRASFFVRRLTFEIKEKQNVNLVEWKKIIPFNNRTIARMLTISTGTFTAVDMADAAVRSAVTSVDMTSFTSNLILRVNFVGIGRMTVAVTTDAGMGLSRNLKKRSRMKIQAEQLNLLNAKIEYKQADTWIAAEETQKTIEEAYEMAEISVCETVNTLKVMQKSLDHIGEMVPDIEKKNPKLLKDIQSLLKD